MTTMNAPKLELCRTTKNGNPAIEVVVRNATTNAELDALTTSLGYVPTVGVANRRSIVCCNATELDAVRNPIAKFFDRTGSYVG